MAAQHGLAQHDLAVLLRFAGTFLVRLPQRTFDARLLNEPRGLPPGAAGQTRLPWHCLIGYNTAVVLATG